MQCLGICLERRPLGLASSRRASHLHVLWRAQTDRDLDQDIPRDKTRHRKDDQSLHLARICRNRFDRIVSLTVNRSEWIRADHQPARPINDHLRKGLTPQEHQHSTPTATGPSRLRRTHGRRTSLQVAATTRHLRTHFDSNRTLIT